jgi:DNA uptake protein ComE-like DNA-binding protein
LEKIILYFKKILSVSYAEAKGFLMLLAVSVLALLVIFFPKILIRSSAQIEPADVEKLDSLLALMKRAELTNRQEALFRFDPNVLPVDSLVLLGFPEKIAQRLDNYRAKGGRFFIKTDVKKIYGISEELYLSIEPYIMIPDTPVNISEMNARIDINAITERGLEEVPEIGRVLAGRIISYRKLLGGFVSVDQLDEVYQLEESALDALKHRAFVQKGFIPERLKINQATTEELMRHPYISGQLAEDIVRFRDINGAIESEKLLASFKSVDKGNFEKLISYLDFQ